MFGGEDHKTGQKSNTKRAYARLLARLKKIIPQARVDHRWSGQIISTSDGLPYIGENAERQFIATGYCGNGITFGTIAAMMARDWTAEKKSMDRPVRSGPQKNQRRRVELLARKQGLSLLHDQRSARSARS